MDAISDANHHDYCVDCDDAEHFLTFKKGQTILKVHITNLYGMAYNSVAQIAQQMVAKIAVENFHFNELGIYNYYDPNESQDALNSRFDGIMSSIGNDDVIIFQSPNWNSIEWEKAFLARTHIYAGIKRIFFIHDVIPLMFDANYYLLDDFIQMYNEADVIILPSQQMLDFLRAHGLTVKKVLIQHMWDHVCQINPLIQPQNNKLITYIGSTDKSASLKDWSSSDVKLRIFAKPEDWGQDKNVEFMGWQDDATLISMLRQAGGFGLLWGDKADWVKYMKLNCSYKISTYLAAGIPVIVPANTPEAIKIQQKNLGIVVNSLDEAVERVNQLSDDDYAAMRQSVSQIGGLIRDGYFTKHLLADAVYKTFYE